MALELEGPPRGSDRVRPRPAAEMLSVVLGRGRGSGTATVSTAAAAGALKAVFTWHLFGKSENLFGFPWVSENRF